MSVAVGHVYELEVEHESWRGGFVNQSKGEAELPCNICFPNFHKRETSLKLFFK